VTDRFVESAKDVAPRKTLRGEHGEPGNRRGDTPEIRQVPRNDCGADLSSRQADQEIVHVPEAITGRIAIQ
jgi:hypothetical protein